MDTDVHTERALIFRLLVGYRWLSLLPPLIVLLWLPVAAPAGWLLLGVAGFFTLGLTLTTKPINRRLLRYPWLLGIDLLLSALLTGLTGVEHSPYYLYSLAPLLAAAYFFHIRGGLVAAGLYALLYLGVLLVQPASFELLSVTSQLISFLLIGAIFGYPSRLTQRLRQAHTQLADQNIELAQRNRELRLIQELLLVMQSSVDPAELQETILHGLVEEMGYRRAVIGLYDEPADRLSGWIGLERSPAASNGRQNGLAHTDVISLEQGRGPLVQALKGNKIFEILDGRPPLTPATLGNRLVQGPHYLILPLWLRDHPIGLLLIDRLPPERPLAPVERRSLEYLSTHAGVALGSIRLCIERAQRQIITDERQRLATHLHDNVSQALYGLAYGLEAAIQLLSPEPRVQQVLINLHETVAEAQGQLRQVIVETCPAEMTAAAFMAGLHRYLRIVSPVQSLNLRIELPGDFDDWAGGTRRQLYQVAQEAVANTAKHAHANQVVVKLNHGPEQIELRIADDGDGFNLAEVDCLQHLGLQRIAERIESLGGSLEIDSAFGEGTLIVAKVPYIEKTRL